jgi:hypothetical protein
MAIESRATQIAAIGYTFVIISSIATCLRVYCRVWVVKAFGADDWLALIAQVGRISPIGITLLTEKVYVHRLLLL